MAGRLQGKAAIITGTGGGQGRAAAILFAKEGAKVVGCDLKAEGAQKTVEMVKAAGGEMVSLQPLDLGEEAQVKKLIDFAVKTCGKIDILYNNAAAARFAPIEELNAEQWHFTMRNELDVVYYACHYAWPYLKQTRGNIINTASIAGLASEPWLPPYKPFGMSPHSAGKGGVIAFSRQLAVEGGPHGVRVNSICPGVIAVEGRFRSEEQKRSEAAWVPMQRTGAPEEIATAALFLASDDASYITGISLIVDGGITAH